MTVLFDYFLNKNPNYLGHNFINASHKFSDNHNPIVNIFRCTICGLKTYHNESSKTMFDYNSNTYMDDISCAEYIIKRIIE